MEFEPVSLPVIDARDAVRRAERCIVVDPPSRALRVLLHLMARFPREARLHHLAARVLVALERPREAECEYHRALLIDPDAEDAAIDLAELLLEDGRASEARCIAASVVSRGRASHGRARSSPRGARACGLLGDTLKALGLRNRAARAYREALQLDPGFAWAGRELSEILCDAGRFEAARRILLRLLDRDPLDPYTHGFLGDLLRRIGREDEALEAFRTALWLSPARTGYSWAAWQLAGILCERGDLEEARAVLRRGLQLEPDEPWLLTSLGSVERRMKKMRAAERCFRRALGIARGLGPAFDGLVGILLEEGRIEEASELYAGMGTRVRCACGRCE